MKPKWRKAEEFWRMVLRAKGRLLPGSGSIAGLKGDCRYLDPVKISVNGLCLLESKQTDKQSLSIQLTWLQKITDEATQLGRIPLLGIAIGNERWIAVPTWALDIGESHEAAQHTVSRRPQEDEPRVYTQYTPQHR